MNFKMPTKSHFVLSVQLLIVKTIRQTHANQMLNIIFPVIGSHEQEVKFKQREVFTGRFLLSGRQWLH
jgi:hypothetical protein